MCVVLTLLCRFDMLNVKFLTCIKKGLELFQAFQYPTDGCICVMKIRVMFLQPSAAWQSWPLSWL